MKDSPLLHATNMFNQLLHLERSSTNQPDIIVRLGPKIKMLSLALRKFESKQMIHCESLDTIVLFITFTHQPDIPSALDTHRVRHQATVYSPPYTTQTSQERFQWVMHCLLYPDLTSCRSPITYSSFRTHVLCPASPIVALFHDNPSPHSEDASEKTGFPQRKWGLPGRVQDWKVLTLLTRVKCRRMQGS